MTERLSRLGALIGGWNDRRNGGWTDTYPSARCSRSWRIVDRLAGWLYTLPERGRP